MKLLLTILFIAVFLAILVLHVLSVRSKSRTASLAGYICIALHIVLFTLMLLLAVPMDLAVLTFMISVLWYSALSAARYMLLRRMRKDGEES